MLFKFKKMPLPGFGLPLRFRPRAQRGEIEALGEGKDLFPHALDAADAPAVNSPLRLKPLRELTMLRFMNEITETPGWEKEVLKDHIAYRWKHQMLNTKGEDMTPEMADWCIAELRFKAKLFGGTKTVSVYDADVVKSERVITPALKRKLQIAVRPLEKAPDRLKDWQPGSDGTMYNLIDPNLFPLVYGRSRILQARNVTLPLSIDRTGEGKAIPIPADEGADATRDSMEASSRPTSSTDPFSRRFQWLPCDVTWDGRDAKFRSYINNLHPFQNKGLYRTLEEIITQVIPMWNQSLTPVVAKNCGFQRLRGVECTHNSDTRTPVQPEPRISNLPRWPSHMTKSVVQKYGHLNVDKTVDLFRDYKDRGLQVIVKLATVHLTPENPEYRGDPWQVVGKLNEHICASAVYYYDSQNVTPGQITFRQQVRDENVAPPSDEQDRGWFKDIYGCDKGGPYIQELGSVAAREDQLITWPNVLQYQDQPFGLVNPHKEGHRKMLALYLVDPNIRIISTSNIPNQRLDWLEDAKIREERRKEPDTSGRLKRTWDPVMDENFPITLEDAKQLRLELLDERHSS